MIDKITKAKDEKSRTLSQRLAGIFVDKNVIDEDLTRRILPGPATPQSGPLPTKTN